MMVLSLNIVIHGVYDFTSFLKFLLIFMNIQIS